ncbi:MAG: C1 family peptidase [Bacteroides sp.]|jgi:bleomycin hydrolase|nr:C1 family peptidase [Bacteroides sp.]MCI1683433.1 C1 family peptidase [Bacteroides sp.]
MRNRTILFTFLFGACFFSLYAQEGEEGISETMLTQIRQSYQGNSVDKAFRNAICNNDIRKLALNQDNLKGMDTYFSIKVNSKGITDQKSSGRCWLFTGLNVMRAKAIAKYGFQSFEYSEVYTFFWDQLEKSNLFLQSVIDTRDKPMEDKNVEWLFKHPLSDGGTFTGVADIVMKYGLVPKEAMPETNSSENTSRMADLLSLKLKEFGLQLRDHASAGSKLAALEQEKTEMLGTVYRMLVLNLGVPPTEFTYVRKDAKGDPVETEHHTPISFFKEYGDEQLITNYVMLMNDPTREYYKCYEIDYDRHRYDGKNWTYVNLPVEDIKEMAIASLKDSTMMYFSCDVGKFLNSDRGLLDVDNYDYGSLMGTTFGMNKKQRIQTFSSGSSHAMTLMAVDLNKDGKPLKWMVENSWGTTSGYQGHLIMTDKWFDEYMFRLVVEAKYVPEKTKKIFKQKPVRLPAWDPMFTEEN